MINDSNLLEKVTQLETENSKLKAEIAKLKILNNWYLEQIRLAAHRRFGQSSEQTVLNQLGLFNEAEVTADDAPEETVTYKRKKRVGKREEFFEGLPTEQTIHELPENERICPKCGGPLHACGHEVLRREVKVIPARISAEEHIQTVYGCYNCDKNGIEESPMIKSDVPAPVIPNSGMASPGLPAFILCNKYVLALPLYRQEQEFKRAGIHIPRQNMANWMIFAAMRRLLPIYILLQAYLLENDILHTDETTLQVIKEAGRKAAQKSYMWIYQTGKDAKNQVVLFEYTQTREGKHPQNFLEGFSGWLHVDAYIGYKAPEDKGVILVECYTHCRRGFDEALKALPKADRQNAAANIGIDYCNQLFKLESIYEEMELEPEKRARWRELLSKPIAEAFFAWAESMLPKALPKSKFGQAVGYAVNQKHWLMNFFLDGRLEISNNRAENKIRPFIIGRNNRMFSFSPKGAKASAIAYSIVETAQLNGLVPSLYLKFLFETLPNIPKERYAECLPWSPKAQELCKIPTIK